MPLTGTFTLKFDKGRPDESASYSVSDDDAKTLRAFLDDVLVFERVLPSLELHTLSIGMSAKIGEPTEFRAREPGVLQRAALLHHLRPFVLNDEPYSFFRTRNIVAQSVTGAELAARLKQIKLLFGGKVMQSQFVISDADGIVNAEATLVRWLNAFEYHRDSDKAAELEKRLSPLPAGFTRPLFFMLLAQKAHAVIYLAHIVAKILGYTSEPSKTDV
jgi:hypothetical protein